MGARIIGTGSAVPSTCLTNTDLAERVDTNDKWIVTRTGIEERRVMKQDEELLDLIHSASETALKAAGLSAQDLDAIVVATVSGEYAFPSTACLLQARLGVDDIAAFDVAAACAGFVYGLSVVHSYLKSGDYNRILLVGADALSTMVNWRDRTTCVLFGDGAGAIVLENQSGDRGLLSTIVESSGSLWKLLHVRTGHRQTFDQKGEQDSDWGIQMKGPELFKVAVRALSDVTKKALEKCGLARMISSSWSRIRRTYALYKPWQTDWVPAWIKSTAMSNGLGTPRPPPFPLLSMKQFGQAKCTITPLLSSMAVEGV